MNKLGLLVMPLMAISLLASCGPTAYTVSLGDIKGVTITPATARRGEDYIAIITIDVETADGELPKALRKVTVGDKELATTDYAYTVHEDCHSADFVIPKNNVTGNIVIDLSLLSFKIDNQTEYEHAMLMKDVLFLQADGQSKAQYLEKYSPNVFYDHNIREKSDGSIYEVEKYVEHAADDTYWEYTKENGKWIKEEAYSSLDFKTPSDFATSQNLDDIAEQYPISAFTYKNGYYSIDIIERDIPGKVTLQFFDKKLVSFDLLATESHKYCYLSYEEITPELPITDPTL